MREGIPRAAILCAAGVILLSAAPGSCQDPRAVTVCDGTLAAWREDRGMQQYMNDYDCRCSNGNSSPPVCSAKGGGSRGPAYGGGGGGGKKRGPSDEQLVLRELQSQVDRMFQVNWQAHRKYQQESLRNAQQIHRDQQAAQLAEEERRKAAAREEAHRKEIEALEVHTELLGMPTAKGGDHILGITGALDEDARRRQLAECPGIREKIARYESGIRRIDDVMARNDRMIRDAQAEAEKAGEELSKVRADATAEALSMGLKSFVQTQKSLQGMKDALARMGMERNFGGMSHGQIVQAQKWMDRGLAHGQNVIDLTQKSIEYRKTTSLRGNGGFAASPYADQLKTALSDFNDKFMYDAGGWELLGENLASVMGPAWEISFKSALAGIKATAAGIGMKLSEGQLRGFTENQDRMGLERFRLEQRIERLKAHLVDNRCPAAADGAPDAPVAASTALAGP